MADRAPHEAFLTADDRAALEALGPVEVTALVHFLNGAAHAERILDGVAAGVSKHAAGRRGAVLVADAGSQDATADIVRAWSRPPDAGAPARLALQLAGHTSRGQIVGALLGTAQSLGAEACVLLDGALIGLSPGWLAPLLGAVLAGEAEFVSLAYSRNRAEGTLTTNLLAPLTRALYGKRVQQIAGGGVGFTRRVLDGWLAGSADADWSAEGVEIGLQAEALVSGARVAEAHLGRKVTDAGAAPPDLATTLVQTVGPVLALMERHQETWPDIRGSAPVPLLGEAPALLASGDAPPLDRMVRAFRLGLKDLLPLWEQVIPEPTLAQLYPLGLLDGDEFRLGPELWARVVSDFCIAYHERRLPHDHLLRALTPLYLGRVATFLADVLPRPERDLPESLEAIGRAFEAEKTALVARWR